MIVLKWITLFVALIAIVVLLGFITVMAYIFIVSLFEKNKWKKQKNLYITIDKGWKNRFKNKKN